MADKRTWAGILVTVLVFGVTVVSCNNSLGNDDQGKDPFSGIWTNATMRIVAANGSFNEYLLPDEKEVVSGTYTFSGNIVTGKMSNINTVMFGDTDNWVTYADLSGTYKGYIGPEIQTFTISGTTFTAGGMTFTKQANNGGISKTLVITGVTGVLMVQGSEGGLIILFPAGTSFANVTADLQVYTSGSGSYQYAKAGNSLDNIDPPVQAGSSYTVTIPLYNGDESTTFTGSGKFDVYLALSDGINDRVYKLANVSVSVATTTVSASGFTLEYTGENQNPKIQGSISLTNIPTSPAPKNIWVGAYVYAPGGSSVLWGSGNNPGNRLNPVLNTVSLGSGAANLSWYMNIDDFWSSYGGTPAFFPAEIQFRVYISYDVDTGGAASGVNSDGYSDNYTITIPGRKTVNSLEDAMSTGIDLGTVNIARQVVPLASSGIWGQLEGTTWQKEDSGDGIFTIVFPSSDSGNLELYYTNGYVGSFFPCIVVGENKIVNYGRDTSADFSLSGNTLTILNCTLHNSPYSEIDGDYTK